MNDSQTSKTPVLLCAVVALIALGGVIAQTTRPSSLPEMRIAAKPHVPDSDAPVSDNVSNPMPQKLQISDSQSGERNVPRRRQLTSKAPDSLVAIAAIPIHDKLTSAHVANVLRRHGLLEDWMCWSGYPEAYGSPLVKKQNARRAVRILANSPRLTLDALWHHSQWNWTSPSVHPVSNSEDATSSWQFINKSEALQHVPVIWNSAWKLKPMGAATRLRLIGPYDEVR